jgi:hypothetical protein
MVITDNTTKSSSNIEKLNSQFLPQVAGAEQDIPLQFMLRNFAQIPITQQPVMLELGYAFISLFFSSSLQKQVSRELLGL